MIPIRSLFAALSLATPVLADPPRVAVDIAPVHALTAQVMAGVGQPDLVVAPTVSPHSYALRPSQAQALQQADLVIWIGPQLTPWMQSALETLAPEAQTLALLSAQGTHVLALRDGPDEHVHDGTDHDGDDHDSHDHGDHDDHGHEDTDQTNAQRPGAEDAHAAQDGLDPHAWLDPENAKVWLGLIARQLAEHDPGNAALYRDNARRARDELDALSAEIERIVMPVKARPYVTFHDAYQYFEARFGLTFAGAVRLGDATDASPARLTRLQREIAAREVHCAFAEPQFDDRLLQAAAGDGGLQFGTLDPMGSGLDIGPDLYARLLRDLALGQAGCP